MQFSFLCFGTCVGWLQYTLIFSHEREISTSALRSTGSPALKPITVCVRHVCDPTESCPRENRLTFQKGHTSGLSLSFVLDIHSSPRGMSHLNAALHTHHCARCSPKRYQDGLPVSTHIPSFLQRWGRGTQNALNRPTVQLNCRIRRYFYKCMPLD